MQKLNFLHELKLRIMNYFKGLRVENSCQKCKKRLFVFSSDSANGFTLIEVLLSTTVLVIGILAWVVTQNANIKGRVISNTITTAVELGDSALDELGCSVQNWSLGHSEDSGTSTQTIGNVSYQIEWDTRQDILVPDGRAMWRIRVIVRWNLYGDHSVTLEKLIVGT